MEIKQVPTFFFFFCYTCTKSLIFDASWSVWKLPLPSIFSPTVSVKVKIPECSVGKVESSSYVLVHIGCKLITVQIRLKYILAGRWISLVFPFPTTAGGMRHIRHRLLFIFLLRYRTSIALIENDCPQLLNKVEININM